MAHIRRMLRGTDGRHHRAGGCGDDGTVRVRERSCACRVCVMCARTLRGTCARVGGSDYGPRGLRCTSCATYNYDYLIAAALCNAVMSGLTHATGSPRERADSPLSFLFFSLFFFLLFFFSRSRRHRAVITRLVPC